MQGTTSSCTINNDSEQCTFDQTTQLTLQPIGKEVCLLLSDDQNRPMATVAIQLKEVSYVCKQRSEYFTRDHEFYTESRHQCYNTESCTENACSALNPETKLHDFSTISNSNPGFTFCVPSCRCLWCNWCFHCSSSCLFYRYYALTSHQRSTEFFPVPHRISKQKDSSP